MLLFKRTFFCCLSAAVWLGAAAQKDSTHTGGADAADMDALFSELELLLDSIAKPKSLTAVSLMAGNRLLNVQNAAGKAVTEGTLTVSPSVSYNHKSGFGLAASMAFLNRNGSLKPSQYLASFSYDYMRLKGMFAGAAFTRFIQPGQAAAFYTSPLKNELSAYALYRKSWFKPSLSLSYGWGSQTEITEQQTLLEALRKKGKKKGSAVPVNTVTNTTESVSDWMISFSVRHDFYFFGVLSRRDNIRLTPQLSFNGGTQQYGFNQTTTTYLLKRSGSTNKPFFSDGIALQDATHFQPLSVTAYFRTAYSKGKFFIQPQFVLDYYIPADSQNWNASFAINSGLIF